MFQSYLIFLYQVVSVCHIEAAIKAILCEAKALLHDDRFVVLIDRSLIGLGYEIGRNTMFKK